MKMRICKMAAIAWLVAVGSVMAQGVPALINYQGVLYDDSGNPATSGSYEIQFRVWDQAAGGNLIWGENYLISAWTNGQFNVLLGSGGGTITNAPFPSQANILDAFGGDSRFLGLTILVKPSGTVASPTEILPRQRLVSAPYAIHALSAVAATNAWNATNAVNATNAANAALLNGLPSTAFLRTNSLPGATSPRQVLDWDGTTAALAPMAVDSSGWLGIGTMSPASPVHIVGPNTMPITVPEGIHLGRDASGNFGIQIARTNGYAYIDFNTKTNTDYDARIILTPQTNLEFHGQMKMMSATHPEVVDYNTVNSSSVTVPALPVDRFVHIWWKSGSIKVTIAGDEYDAAAANGYPGIMSLAVQAGQSFTIAKLYDNIAEIHVKSVTLGLP